MADSQLRARPGKAKAKPLRTELDNDDLERKRHKVQPQYIVLWILTNSIRVLMLLKRMPKGNGVELHW
jgi:hypothetical protein